ncbi:MAG: hypothetical protein ABIP54_04085 [Candidatus Andersenbacteria bacterium]
MPEWHENDRKSRKDFSKMALGVYSIECTVYSDIQEEVVKKVLGIMRLYRCPVRVSVARVIKDNDEWREKRARWFGSLVEEFHKQETPTRYFGIVIQRSEIIITEGEIPNFYASPGEAPEMVSDRDASMLGMLTYLMKGVKMSLE